MKLLFLSIAAIFITLAMPAVPASAGSWVVTYSVTNSKSTSQSSGANAGTNAASSSAFVAINADLAGATSGSKFAEADGSYTGSCTLQWMPDNSTDWPSATTIRSGRFKILRSFVNAGTGTAKITDGSSTVLVSSTLPNTATNVQDYPEPVVTTDTSQSHLTITTTTITQHSVNVDNGYISEGKTEIANSVRAYDALWFTSHFTNAADVSLTFSLTGISLNGRIDLDTTSTDISALVAGIATETYSVE